MIQLSLQLWPKHCTSVGGPIKVLHSCLWELQPLVKDSSLEQHILKSGLALPSVDSLAFALLLFLRRLLQESMSVHLNIKMRPGKAKTTPPSTVEAQHRSHEVPMGAPPSVALSGRQPLSCLTLTGTVGIVR